MPKVQGLKPQRMTTYLTKPQLNWLRGIAHERSTTIASIIREIVEEARRRAQPQEELPLE